MTNCQFQVPNELRDFAEGSVEQARKTFEGFLAVAERAAGATGDAVKAGQAGMKSVGAHVSASAEQNVNAAFDLANRLAKAKDPQEMFALQSEYAAAQLAALQRQAKELGSVVQRSIKTPASS